MKNNNKTIIVAIAALAIIGIISGTYAYFTSTATVTNSFTAQSYETIIQRDIKAANWVPGATIKAGTAEQVAAKTADYQNLNVKNNGSTKIAVRATVVESFTNKEGRTRVLSTKLSDGSFVITKTWGADWVEVGDATQASATNSTTGATTHTYYYTKILDDQTGTDTTSNLITSLTFNAKASNNATCTYVDATDDEDTEDKDETLASTGNVDTAQGQTPTRYPENDPHTGNVVCTSDGYDESIYTVAITFDTIQATALIAGDSGAAEWTEAPTALKDAAQLVTTGNRNQQ